MGCFSFICQKSGKAVNSSSFDGDQVHLFLLKDGKVIEEMFGNYDSYGRVFNVDQRQDVAHELRESFKWKMDWHKVCDLMFNSDDSNGIAAILHKHYNGEIPTKRSKSDPNQGWGKMTNKRRVKNPYHKVY